MISSCRPECRRLGIFLRRDGVRINHKKLLRLYRSEGLVLPRKRPKRRLWQRPKRLLAAARPNERWWMDFVQDRLRSGRRFRILTIVDDYTREWKATVVDTSIGGVRVVRLLEDLRETTGLPDVIVSDNEPEFTSRAFLSWAERRGIDLRFIQPSPLFMPPLFESPGPLACTSTFPSGSENADEKAR